ncbi:MAG: ABC transporter substrate-binding protein [Myxococcales bacterium]|nr:ABC transporter substrate-binding protein [Myxococcales bacterium]
MLASLDGCTGTSELRRVKKPEHQWETRRFVAVRTEAPPAAWLGEAGAQGFELRPRDGGEPAWAVFSLARQAVDPRAADDDLVFAAKAWLGARGGRRIHLSVGERVIAETFDMDALSDPTCASAQRIATLCPSNAEIVGALGCFDRVVACEDSSDWPEEVTRCERLGPDLGPDLDRVAALAPDLVVSSLSVPGMERNVTGLRVRGVRQRVLAPRSLTEVIAEVERVGADLGAEARAAAVRTQIEGERDELRARLPTRPVRVYLEWWPRPMFSPGADCYSNELIGLAGGINVFAGRPGASVEVTADEVVAARPEVCFVSWCGVAEAKLDPDSLIRRAPGLAAAEAGRVYRVDERFSGRPGPRMLEAARVMGRAIAAYRRAHG